VKSTPSSLKGKTCKEIVTLAVLPPFYFSKYGYSLISVVIADFNENVLFFSKGQQRGKSHFL